LDWKLRTAIQENLEAGYLRYGKKWKPLKQKNKDDEMDANEVSTLLNNPSIYLIEQFLGHFQEKTAQEENPSSSELQPRNTARSRALAAASGTDRLS
jgi:hypothetical protein